MPSKYLSNISRTTERMKYFYTTFYFLIFSAMVCFAQEEDTIPEPKKWEFSVSNYLYLLPDDVYSAPAFIADQGHLHLAARYNYENFMTGSVFGGYNFSTGDKFNFNVTPELGVVFGKTNGIAPGLILDMYFGKFNLYSESEYLFDFSGKESNYFYAWSELTMAPVEWLQFGIALQRTRVFKTDLEVQPGLTLGFNWKFLSVGGYVFNLGWDDPYGILAIEVRF